MSDARGTVKAIARNKLDLQVGPAGGAVPAESIRAAVLETIAFLGCRDVDAETIVAELETAYKTFIGAERALLGKDEYMPWLKKRKTDISWAFWDRYRDYLLEHKEWPSAILTRLDSTTDRLLDFCGAPDRDGPWDRRGMVVGHVQSGKTSNYVGLICKAADAGYKVIIVLAGFHKSLRTQTQVRLEEGFLGYSRGQDNTGQEAALMLGVGNFDPTPRADSITTRADDGDFKRQVANKFGFHPGGKPLLFVIKKNASVLRNLLNWVRFAADAKDEHGRKYVKNIPLLMIDDEADQGSIDTRAGAFDEDGQPDPEHDPSALNRYIRQILKSFDQSVYVGYTATPFANVFIHERAKTESEGEDLFPRSFILSLRSPSNYVGPSKLFGTLDRESEYPGRHLVRVVTDHADSLATKETEGWVPPKHNKHHHPLYLGLARVPPTLDKAIRSFVLACAMRIARGQHNKHNSMLVHVTRFTRVQHLVAEQVSDCLQHIKDRLRYEDDGVARSLGDELKSLWQSDFQPTTGLVQDESCQPLPWESIKPNLTRAALSISIRKINGDAGEVLDYEKHKETGLNVIAIGGDKLSRGLTLEGLTVSYFLRASRMYDTLMQMGRWFGYRPGYLDVCRIYTTAELVDWFSHITAANEELRDDFDRMDRSGSTPREFGHRVQSHPLMMVTSQVKMRHGKKIDISFQGDICETVNFWRTANRLEHNWKAGRDFLNGIESDGATLTRIESDSEETNTMLWTGVSPERVIAFLDNYREHGASRKVKTRLLSKYVQSELSALRLTNWSVLVASGESLESADFGSKRVKKVVRSWKFSSSSPEDQVAERRELISHNHFRIRRLLDPKHEIVDLGDPERAKALAQTLKRWEAGTQTKKKPVFPAGADIRSARLESNGLLMVYPLSGEDENGECKRSRKVKEDARRFPVLGFAISFPEVDPSKASKVKYDVGNIYWEQEVNADDGFDEDGEEDS